MENDVFQIDEELASSLQELDDDELECFAELHESSTNDAEMELFIFACLELFKRTRAQEWAQRAAVQADLWIASTILSDDHVVRRYRIPIFISGTVAAYGHVVEGDPEIRSKNINDVLQGTRYEATDSLDVLNLTIEVAEFTLTQMPSNHPQRQRLSMDLGRWFVDRYDKTGNLQDLRNAIQIVEGLTAVQLVDSHTHAHRLADLGRYIWKQYDREKDPRDLDRGIDIFRRALSLSFQCDNGLHATLRTNIGNLQVARFRQSQNGVELDEAISMLQTALAASSRVQSYDSTARDTLAISLILKYMHTEEHDNMNQAIESFTTALETNPRSDGRMRSSLLYNMGMMLQMIDNKYNRNETYDWTGPWDYLDRAIEVAEVAVRAVDCSGSVATAILTYLGLWLVPRFKYKGSSRDLDRSIEVLELAMQAMPAGYHKRGWTLCELSNRYGMRHDLRGHLTDLYRAGERAEQAVRATPAGDPDRPRQIAMLGVFFIQRFESTGRRADIDSSLDLLAEGVETTPSTNPNWHVMMSNLATYYFLLSERTKNMDDLNHAIDILDKTLDKCPEDHPQRMYLLRNLAVQLLRRCQGNVSGIEDGAIKGNILEACIYLRTPLLHRYTSDLSDINRAIDLIHAALDYNIADHLFLASLHQELGRCFNQRYFMTLPNTGPTHDTLADISHAIDNEEEAIKAIPQDHPLRAVWQFSLSSSLRTRFEQTKDEADQRRFLECIREVWSCRNAEPSLRMHAARKIVLNLPEGPNHKEVADILEEAVRLLPALCPRFLSDADKQSQLEECFGFANEAATAFLEAGKSPSDALQVLETGRGVVASLLLDMRTELSELRQKHPELAQKFETIRDELNTEPTTDKVWILAPTSEQGQPERSQLNRQLQLHEEFEQLVLRIRDQDGFSRFLLPPTADEIMAAAHLGPIVVINNSGRRCDAIIIERQQIKSLRLPDRGTLTSSEHMTNNSHADLSLLPEWLWERVAHPILEELGISKSPSCEDDWPHVWWILTGLTANFPMHAAGKHGQGTDEAVIDRVISSYSTTVKSLIHSRRHSEDQIPNPPTSQHALLTTMAETPNQTSLPFTTQEIAAIQPICKGMSLTPVEAPKQTDEILKYLRTCRIFHFAGHGISNSKDPASSSLLTEDWETNPLTVDKLRQQRLQETAPFLAYLSACSTVATKNPTLMDEGIHLVSAFQLAGFRHAVGTLWEVSDSHCVDVARVLYETLLTEGMTDEAVARGLHRGIRMIRDGNQEDKATVDDRNCSDCSENEDYLMDELGEGVDALDISTETDFSREKRDARPVGSRRRRQLRRGPLFWIPFVHYGP